MVAEQQERTQVRVRLNEAGAIELYEALLDHEVALLNMREAIIGIPEARSLLNRRVTATRRVIQETERAANEQGWPLEVKHDEPQQSNP